MSVKLESRRVLAALRAALGDSFVLTQTQDFGGALEEPRGLYHGKALALAKPGTTAQVAQTLRLCNAAGICVVAQGGNTGLVGGQTPDDSGEQIILSLQRLNRIREIDVVADAMIVEAGVTLAQAQAAAQSVDRLFPLSLASEGSCTIGGNLSTNAGGLAVIAYGNARDLALGLEVVLADGRVLNNLSKLRKDNTGYDLKHLFIGAEGTLGVITAAALKLFAQPRSRATALAGLASPAMALRLLGLARDAVGAMITSFELMPRLGLDLALRHIPDNRDPLAHRHDWYVLIEISSQQRQGLDETMTKLLARAVEAGVVEDATIAMSLDQAARLWRLRESLPEAQRREGGSIKHDISVPLGAAPAFIDEASRAVSAFMPDARVVAFGHLGDGNIHFNIQQPAGADANAFLTQRSIMNKIVHELVGRYGGSISAEHGIGRMKRELLAHTKDPVALAVMRQIKASLDPNGILNAGKVL